jgi:hypothetical protein
MPNAVGVTGGLAMAMVVICVACSTPPQTGAGPAMAPPVAARILPPFQGQVVFDINQPTYVAVFDVRPYIGVEMIYPGPNDPGQATGGVQAVPVYYLAQADEERRAQATPFVGNGEAYLFLVASRTPLDLGEFAVHPIALSEAAGVALHGLPPFDEIDSLMCNVVKPRYDADWDADVLILTPGNIDGSISGDQLGVTCGNGASPRICAHADHIVPTFATTASQGLAMPYAPNGVARSAAVTRTAGDDWKTGSDHAQGKGANAVRSGTATAGQTIGSAPAGASVQTSALSTGTVITGASGAHSGGMSAGKP